MERKNGEPALFEHPVKKGEGEKKRSEYKERGIGRVRVRTKDTGVTDIQGSAVP